MLDETFKFVVKGGDDTVFHAMVSADDKIVTIVYIEEGARYPRVQHCYRTEAEENFESGHWVIVEEVDNK